MDRTELTLAITTALIMAAVLGWVLRWVYGRLNRSSSPDVENIDDLASRLHQAEENRDGAIRELENVRGSLTRQLMSKEAELEATMSGLGDARRTALEWKEAYEALAVHAEAKT